MKKVILPLLALAFAVSFSACGGKTEGGAEANDSTKADSAQVTEEAQSPTGTIDVEAFTVTTPEGWEATSKSSNSVRMEDVKSKETFKPVITIRVQENRTVKDKEDYYQTKTKGFSKGADVTIGSYTFTTFRNPDSELYDCFTQLEGGSLLIVELAYFEPESEILKPVVESLKIK